MRPSETRRAIKEAGLNPFKMKFKNMISPAEGTTVGDIMLQSALVAGAAGGVGGLGAAGWDVAEDAINKGVHAVKSRVGEARGYKRMLAHTGAEDTDTRRKAFHTLHTFAPDLAKDPMVAGTFVKRVVDFDENIDPSWVKNLVDAQARHRPAGPRGPSGGGQIFGGTIARGVQSGMSDASNAFRADRDFKLRREDADRRQETHERGSPFQRQQEEGRRQEAAKARAITRAKNRMDARAKQRQDEMARASFNLNLTKAKDEGREDEYGNFEPRYPNIQSMKKKAALDRSRVLRAQQLRLEAVRTLF